MDFFEQPRPAPSPSSQYTSHVSSSASSVASRGGYSEFHSDPIPDDIHDLFEELLDRLNSGYLYRQSLKQQLQDTEEAIVAANWDLFLLDHQRRHPNPSSLPLPPGARSPSPRHHRARTQQQQPGWPQLARQHALAALNAAVSRRHDLWDEVKAATAGVEDHMGVFWRLLRMRARARDDDDDIVGRVRALLVRASSGELEKVRALLDGMFPRALSVGAARSGREAAAAAAATTTSSPGALAPPSRMRPTAPWADRMGGEVSSKVRPGVQMWI